MIYSCVITCFILIAIGLCSTWAEETDTSEADPSVFNVETGKVAMRNMLNFINERSPISSYENLINDIDKAANYEGLANVAQEIGGKMSPDILKETADQGILPIFLVPHPATEAAAAAVEGNKEDPELIS